MTRKNRWLLPEGIEEVLPPQAAELESLCRQILDQFATWGYERVMPPLIEYLDSLLTGTGEDLDLQTFKITDQMNGKMMGIRADTTPQVARIEVHNLKRNTPHRLCYLGTVLHTLPGESGGTRAPLQVGAELYGHDGLESDAEILALMLKTLQLAGLKNIHVDIAHVGLLQGLIYPLGLNPGQQTALFDTLQRKAVDELANMLSEWSVDANKAEVLLGLADMAGDISILDDIRRMLKQDFEDVCIYVDELQKIAELTLRRVKNAPLYFDVTEFRGYHYYTGMTFVAYVPGQSQGIAFGGRYDEIGEAFGQARPATGFSTDAKLLFQLTPHSYEKRKGIYAPNSEVPGLYEVIDGLRSQGEIVISDLPGQNGTAQQRDCDRELVLEAGKWKVKPLN